MGESRRRIQRFDPWVLCGRYDLIAEARYSFVPVPVAFWPRMGFANRQNYFLSWTRRCSRVFPGMVVLVRLSVTIGETLAHMRAYFLNSFV